MPKLKKSDNTDDFNCLKVIDSSFYCILCKIKLTSFRDTTLKRHFRTMKHKTAKALHLKNFYMARDQFQQQEESMGFNIEPLLNETVVQEQVITSNFRPIREPVVIPEHDEQSNMQRMREIAKGNYIWLGIDERKDEYNGFVVSFVFGVLAPEKMAESHLLHRESLMELNPGTIATMLDESVHDLGVNTEKILLLIKNVSKDMSETSYKYPRMMHINCLSRTFYEMDAFIKDAFLDVHRLITKFYEMMLQNPPYYSLLKNCYLGPNATPPIPNYGNWTATGVFFAEHWSEIKRFADTIPDNTEDSSVIKAKNAVRELHTEKQLQYIWMHFKSFSTCLERLKTLPLFLAYEEFNDVLCGLDSIEDQKYSDRFREILKQNNQNLFDIQEIVLVLSEQLENNFDCTTSRNHTQEELKALNCIPLVCKEVKDVISEF